jgi:hypothetical protein
LNQLKFTFCFSDLLLPSSSKEIKEIAWFNYKNKKIHAFEYKNKNIWIIISIQKSLESSYEILSNFNKLYNCLSFQSKMLYFKWHHYSKHQRVIR